jgi:hypothetical protein
MAVEINQGSRYYALVDSPSIPMDRSREHTSDIPVSVLARNSLQDTVKSSTIVMILYQ